MEQSNYKELALELLRYAYDLTKEHMAMTEAMRHKPNIKKDAAEFLPQATIAVESVFRPLRSAIESGIDFRPALEELLKLP
jgi:hypothetical protein